MGILAEALREIASEKQAAEDELRQALEDFDMITARAADTVKNTVAALRTELQAAGWWAGEVREEAQRGRPCAQPIGDFAGTPTSIPLFSLKIYQRDAT